jgi:hypothetical protein
VTPRRRDLVAVLALLAVVVVYLSPALRDGGTFAPFDLANQLSGLTSNLSPAIHNHLDGDIATQVVPWYTLDWRLVHAGQFPLWNGYEALGMPQFLNFESSVLSLPDLVGYLVPVRDAYLVVVAVKLALAGTGTYLFARVLGLRPSAAFLAGTTFMLSGPFAGWLGWSLADVMAWSGFVAAFTVLAYRHGARLRYVVLLAIAVAFSVYGGFPEANVLLIGAGAVAGFVFAAGRLVTRRPLAGAGLGRVAAGAVAGVALSAPLWLPGAQVLQAAARAAETPVPGLGLHALVVDIFPGWYGLPTSSTPGFGPVNYYESVGYVGIAALVLVIAAVVVLWRDPRVLGLAAAGAACVVAVYGVAGVHPVQSLASSIGASSLGVDRARLVLAFVLAVLAGFGLDATITALRPRARRASLHGRPLPPVVQPPVVEGPAVVSDARWSRRFGDVLLGTALAVAVLTAALAIVGVTSNLPPADHRARVDALLWPCVVAGGTVAVAAVVWVATRTREARRRRVLHLGVLAALIGAQAAYLGWASGGLNSYSHTFFPSTAATDSYTAAVGDSLVGIDGNNPTDVRSWAGVGFYPNVNMGYEVRQFTGHDPVLPAAYLDWPGSPPASTSTVNVFAPDIDSATEARLYGIGYILASVRLPPPPGTVPVTTFAGVRLYRVPDASQVAFAADAPAGARVERVAQGTDRSLTAVVDTPAAATLVLHITDLPGWHVTSDGTDLRVRPDGNLMQQVTVPAGHHTLQIWYWPGRLTTGIWLAAAATLLLVLWAGGAAGARHLRRRSADRQDPEIEEVAA